MALAQAPLLENQVGFFDLDQRPFELLVRRGRQNHVGKRAARNNGIGQRFFGRLNGAKEQIAERVSHC